MECASDEQLLCLVETCFNLLKGRVQLKNRRHYRQLQKQANTLRKLARTRSAKSARHLLQLASGPAKHTCPPTSLFLTGASRSSLATIEPISTAAANRPVRSWRAPMQEWIMLDDPNELEEFMARGEERCIQDIRSFITKFGFSQITVAMMTGVSQSYISKLLKGNHRVLSLRCRKNMYCWYLNCSRHPSRLAMSVKDPNSRQVTNADGELVPQRCKRYVFRPALIGILEAYFQMSPFPDIVKRNDIASVCKAYLQVVKKENQLMQKEIMTPQIVANWFANKRKEMRKEKHRTVEMGNAADRMNKSKQFKVVNRMQLPLTAPHNNNLANVTELAAFQAAKLRENMAVLAAQNPQLIASLDR